MEGLSRIDYRKQDVSDVESEVSDVLAISISQGLNNGGILKFRAAGDGEHCLDLNGALLKLDISVQTMPELTPVDALHEVVLDAGGMHSLFREVDVSLNDELVSSMTAYAYSTALIRLLGVSLSQREGIWDVCDGTWDYVGLQVGKSDATNAGGIFPPGFEAKRDRVNRSRNILIGRVFADVFTSCRPLLPPGVSVDLTMRRAEDRFSLVCARVDEEFRIVINMATLLIPRVRLRPNILHKVLAETRDGASLTFNRLETRIMTIAAGQSQFFWLNCLQYAPLPNRFYVAFVDQRSLYGSWTQYSTYFETARVASLNAKLNGQDIRYKPIEVSFPLQEGGLVDTRRADILEGFFSVVEVLGQVKDLTSPVRYYSSAFLRGYTLYAFELGKCGEKPGAGGTLDLEVF